MQEACILSEALGLPFRNEILQLICEIILTPYKEEFLKTDNATLEMVERRYAWIKRRLKEIESIYEGVYPHYWGVKCFIVNEFCGMTRLHITDILERTPTNDVVGLLKALEATLNFERKISQELKEEYKAYLDNSQNEGEAKDELDEVLESNLDKTQIKDISTVSKEFTITSLPKLKGSISDSFEQYMRPYIEKEEYDARETLIKAFSTDQYDSNSEVKVFDSSITMFNIFKAIMKRASRYSRSQTMFNIWKVHNSLILCLLYLSESFQMKPRFR